MSQLAQLKSPAKTQHSGSVNPFARALAETEQSSGDMGTPPSGLDAFREALMKAKGNTKYGEGSENFQNKDFMAQQQELLKQEKLRKERHAQINPVETQALFDAREKQVKQQIEQIRADLKKASQPAQANDSQVYNTLHTEIVEVGERGSYFTNFYHWLREQVLLWQKNVKSGDSWLHVGKKKRGLGSGNVTKNVQNTMWHENSNNGGAG